ncbi:DUF6319 family protein [Rhodococcus artemisiae]|uniref:DUF6319 family protein n=1 Tax=Rhodococcus artemisiae TaxID=714159 RepID=A0ABU7L5H9_9NOCA|nr:DUF6319 family protein [Rhodococcus artemisiae]MEE2056791.1 DUF6319 family protein [Rhodococcus artemisiae]
MPPRRRADHLTEEQLTELSSALAEGRRATVYLVEGISSLGIEPGTSARVISIEGTTVTVRPKGVNDELPFETDELRFTRDVATKASPKKAAAKAPAATRAPAPKPPAAQPPAATTPPAKAEPTPPASRPAAKEKTTVTSTPANPPSAAGTEPAKPKAPAKRGAKKPAAISITVTIDPENEWTVAVAQGTRKIGKPAAVAPDAVERAVKELGDETAIEAVHSVIDEARRTVEERVAQLSRELEEARKALESLGSNPA